MQRSLNSESYCSRYIIYSIPANWYPEIDLTSDTSDSIFSTYIIQGNEYSTGDAPRAADAWYLRIFMCTFSNICYQSTSVGNYGE